MRPRSEIQFGVLDRNILSEQIAERILQMIKDKQLHPGDLLPPERELAVLMGVSRPSLREGLRALSIMNIIDHRQGKGTYITSLLPEHLVEHLDIVFSLNDSTYLDLFKARRIVEVGSAELAARTITDEEIEELQTCLMRSFETVEDEEKFLESDLELHNKIISATKNPILLLFMRSINKLSLSSRHRTGEFPEIRRQALKDHQKIVEALSRRDPADTQLAMLDHLNHVESILKETPEASKQTA
jgi:GntR family transcriptional regulator, transcriptional repressor for pyruvate dehydrogenase complex